MSDPTAEERAEKLLDNACYSMQSFIDAVSEEIRAAEAAAVAAEREACAVLMERMDDYECMQHLAAAIRARGGEEK